MSLIETLPSTGAFAKLEGRVKSGETFVKYIRQLPADLGRLPGKLAGNAQVIQIGEAKSISR